MVTFDIQNRVFEHLKKCKIFMIPSNNIGKVEGCIILEELNFKEAPNNKEASYEEQKEYIREYYKEVLSKLDPYDMVHKLNGSYLTSDERVESLSKRSIFSEWLKIYSDENINEMAMNENGDFVKFDSSDNVRITLEKIIREEKEDMKGFTSLKALYLYEKSKKLEELSMKFAGDKDFYAHYERMITILRSEAETIDYIYTKNKENEYIKRI